MSMSNTEKTVKDIRRNTRREFSTEEKIRIVLEGHRGEIRCLAFNPTGTQFASGSEDTIIRIWDTVTGRANLLPGHGGPVNHVAFNADGSVLASASFDKTVRLWNPAAK